MNLQLLNGTARRSPACW